MAVFSTNLLIYKHTDFEQTFVLEDGQTNSAKDLTGFTGTCRMQRTLNLGSLTAFTVTFTNRSLGKIRISLTDEQTAVIEGQVIVKHPVTWDSPNPLTPFDAQVP